MCPLFSFSYLDPKYIKNDVIPWLLMTDPLEFRTAGIHGCRGVFGMGGVWNGVYQRPVSGCYTTLDNSGAPPGAPLVGSKTTNMSACALGARLCHLSIGTIKDK